LKQRLPPCERVTCGIVRPPPRENASPTCANLPSMFDA
jgi:hypothetical protein